MFLQHSRFFFLVPKDFLLLRQTDEMYKPLLYHVTAVKENLTSEKIIKNLSEGGCIYMSLVSHAVL